MKSISFLFLMMFGLALTTHGQNQTFTLVTYQQTKVVSVQDGALVALDVNSKEIGKPQQFILKRLINGNILIASAAHPERCFKHTGTNVELAIFNGDASEFEWRIEYVDEDKYLFKHASLTDQCLAIDEKNELSVLSMSLLRQSKQMGFGLFMLVQEEYPF